eukprot:TRINITY_DN67065_c3_g1_i1.p1 TRINITY_DN67065_c3_g1~~TRINITY_DN67065_c3_g1_i1.p1  ORF type:complete len:155 (-),score=13.03 TRINITY_DN67065_c3_g1_i1:50-514(-)
MLLLTPLDALASPLPPFSVDVGYLVTSLMDTQQQCPIIGTLRGATICAQLDSCGHSSDLSAQIAVSELAMTCGSAERIQDMVELMRLLTDTTTGQLCLQLLLSSSNRITTDVSKLEDGSFQYQLALPSGLQLQVTVGTDGKILQIDMCMFKGVF